MNKEEENALLNGFIDGLGTPWLYWVGSAVNVACAVVDISTGKFDGITALFLIFALVWALTARWSWKLKEQRSANNTNDTQ